MRETDLLATSKPSVANSDAHPSTLGALRESGYEVRTVKDEMRANLLGRLASEQPIFDGIVGYDDTVLPSIENAILAGQDICF
jgi:magnesium chelatase subunit I